MRNDAWEPIPDEERTAVAVAPDDGWEPIPSGASDGWEPIPADAGDGWEPIPAGEAPGAERPGFLRRTFDRVRGFTADDPAPVPPSTPQMTGEEALRSVQNGSSPVGVLSSPLVPLRADSVPAGDARGAKPAPGPSATPGVVQGAITTQDLLRYSLPQILKSQAPAKVDPGPDSVESALAGMVGEEAPTHSPQNAPEYVPYVGPAPRHRDKRPPVGISEAPLREFALAGAARESIRVADTVNAVLMHVDRWLQAPGVSIERAMQRLSGKLYGQEPEPSSYDRHSPIGRWAIEQRKTAEDVLQAIDQTYRVPLPTEDPRVLLDSRFWTMTAVGGIVQLSNQMILGGGTIVGGALSGAMQEAVPTFEDLKQSGMPEGEAFVRSLAFGSIVTALEKWGLGKIFNAPTKGIALKAAWNAFTEATSEYGEEVLQPFATALGREGVSLTDFGMQVWQQAFNGLNVLPQSAIMGALGGGGSGVESRSTRFTTADVPAAGAGVVPGGPDSIQLPNSTGIVPGTPVEAGEVPTIQGNLSLTQFERGGYRPWEVTQQDWVNLRRAEQRRLGQPEEDGTAAAPFSAYEEFHAESVRNAVRNGLEVDARVLADYPEFAPEPWMAPESPVEAAPVEQQPSPTPVATTQTPVGETQAGLLRTGETQADGQPLAEPAPVDQAPEPPASIPAGQAREMDATGRPVDGGFVGEGDTFQTSSGRVTSPYPKLSRRQGPSDQAKANQWLIDNAIAEAEARGDDFNATMFRGLSAGQGFSPADGNDAAMYLFGEQPAVAPPITRPLVPAGEQAPGSVPSGPAVAAVTEGFVQPGNPSSEVDPVKGWNDRVETLERQVGIVVGPTPMGGGLLLQVPRDQAYTLQSERARIQKILDLLDRRRAYWFERDRTYVGMSEEQERRLRVRLVQIESEMLTEAQKFRSLSTKGGEVNEAGNANEERPGSEPVVVGRPRSSGGERPAPIEAPVGAGGSSAVGVPGTVEPEGGTEGARRGGARRGRVGGRRAAPGGVLSGGGSGSGAGTVDGGGTAEAGPVSGESRADSEGQRPVESEVQPSPPSELLPEQRNHVIDEGERVAAGGEVSKVRGNMAALRLLAALESDGRLPSPEEKRVLARYVGWGGAPQVFDEYKARWERDDNWGKQWGKFYDELRTLLSDDEWNSAARSTINAHYTASNVIRPIWQAVQRLGFTGRGRVGELGAGIGHFAGMQPAGLREAGTAWTMVEKDAVSGRILKLLYPEARVYQSGLEDVRLPLHSLDLVVGNFPFAKDGPFDKSYPSFSLHNYFFARAVDALRPGGLLAVVTSMSTMDSPSSRSARQWLAERADLVGSIRLPNTAFKENANTEVTTDIIFLRKKDGTPFDGAAWVNTQEITNGKGDVLEINEYFASNPSMMLGEMRLEGSQYRGDEPALIAPRGQDLASALNDAIGLLPENVMGGRSAPVQTPREPGLDDRADEGAQTQERNGSVVFKGSSVYQVEDGSLKSPEWAESAMKVDRAKGFVFVRDALRNVMSLMLSEESQDADIRAAQLKLEKAYDKLVNRHGPVNVSRGGKWTHLEDDPEFASVAALERVFEVDVEVEDANGKIRLDRQARYEKMPIFRQRTMFPFVEPASAESVEDAMDVSQAYRGRMDLDYISKLVGRDLGAVESEILNSGLAFRNPMSGLLEISEEYLSGEVLKKLNEARAAAESDAAYSSNVKALEAVQPKARPIESVEFRIGSTWLPTTLHEGFLQEVFGVGASVQLVGATGSFLMDVRSGKYDALNTTTYGNEDFTGAELFDLSLNLKTPVAYDKAEFPDENGKRARTKNDKRTLAAQSMQKTIESAFKQWVRDRLMADSDLSLRLEKTYNELFNGTVRRQRRVPGWRWYPGMAQNEKMVPRDKQKAAVTRGIQESVLLAHAVGTGKTLIMSTIAMEWRRLRMANKVMIVVQNATVKQIARGFKQTYPAARVLAPSRNQRSAAHRKRLMASIATGDWDAVIIPQSFFNRLSDSPARVRAFMNLEIAQLKAAKYEARREEGERSPKVKDIQRAIQNLETRLKKLLERKVDDGMEFEQLGVDALIVDEAHAYKKLEFQTKMDNIKGLDKGTSQRALGLYMKTTYIQEKHNGKNVVLATGTPISNTLAEAWTMIRLVRPDLLKVFGVPKFDDFAAAFGDTVTNVEQTAGGDFKSVTRFARYVNVRELKRFFHSGADVVLQKDAGIAGIPRFAGGQPQTVVVERTPELTRYVGVLRERLRAFAQMSGRDKRENSHIPLVVYGLGRKASLDMRLVDPALPDEPGSKVNMVADNVARIYADTSGRLGTQLVFADLYQSSDGSFNLYEEMKRKLVERGVKAADVVIVMDVTSEDALERLWAKVNLGQVRVIIGSTEKMGVGVNVQEKAVAIHHMDPPWRPMDMEQRNGRVFRPGNENGEVWEFRYGVLNTLDSSIYQLLDIKHKLTQQILANEDVEVADTLDEQLEMGYAEQMAAYSGNPLAMERVGIEARLRGLEADYQGYVARRQQARLQLEWDKEHLPKAVQLSEDGRRALVQYKQAIEGEPWGVIDGVEYRDRKTLVEALEGRVEGTIKSEAESNKGKQREPDEIRSGRTKVLRKVEFSLFGLPIKGRVYLKVGLQDGMVRPEGYFEYEADVGGFTLTGQVETAAGLLTSLKSKSHFLEGYVKDHELQEERSRKNIVEFEALLGSSFQHGREMEEAQRRLVEIDRELEAAAVEESSAPEGQLDDGGQDGEDGEDQQSLFGGSSGLPAAAAPNWTLDRPESPAGMALVDRVSRAKASLGDIVKHLNQAVRVEMRFSRSQTSRRYPAFYRERGNLVFTRATQSQINFHEAGHSLKVLLSTKARGVFTPMRADLVALTKAPGSMASANTVSEGVAEWVRLRVVNPAAIEGTALSAAMDQALAMHLPKVGAAVRDAARAVHRFSQLPAQQRWALFNQEDRERPGLGKAFQALFRLGSAAADGLASGAPVARVDRSIFKAVVRDRADVGASYREALARARQARGQTRKIGYAYNMILSIGSEVVAAMSGQGTQKGLRVIGSDGNFKVLLRDSWKEIVSRVPGNRMDQFMQAGWALEALNRYQADGLDYPGSKNGITPDDLVQIVAQARRDIPEFDKRFVEVQQYFDALLDIKDMGGLKKPGEVDKMRRRGLYWPLPRVMNRTGAMLGNADRRNIRAGDYRAWGSEEAIADLNVVAEARTRDTLTSYYWNRFGLTLVDNLAEIAHQKELPGLARALAGRALTKMKLQRTVAATLSKEEGRRIVYEYVLAEEARKLGIPPEQLMSTLTPDSINLSWEFKDVFRGKAPSDVNVVSFLRDGEREFYQIGDDGLFMMFARPEQVNKMMAAANWAMGPAMQNWKRNITQSLPFALANAAGDVFNQMMLNTGAVSWFPGGASLLGIINKFRKTYPQVKQAGLLLSRAQPSSLELLNQVRHNAVWQFLAEGFYVSQAKDPTKRLLATLFQPSNWLFPVWKTGDLINLVTGGRAVGPLVETSTREGAAVAVKNALGTDEAAIDAYWRVTGRFNEHSGVADLRAAMSFPGFVNPMVQAARGAVQVLTDPDPAIAAAAWVKLVVVFPALFAAAAIARYMSMSDEDKDRERERPIEDRMNYHDVAGFRIRFPYGPEGAMAAMTYNAVMDDLLGRPSVEGRRAAVMLAKRVVDVGGPLQFLGPQLNSLSEAQVNWSSFRQRHIVSPWMEGLPPSEQYRSTTPEFYRRLGAWVNYSPDKIQYIVQQGISRQIDETIRLLGDVEHKREIRALSDVPYIGRMFIRDPAGFSSASVEQVGDIKAKMQLVDVRLSMGGYSFLKSVRPEEVADRGQRALKVQLDYLSFLAAGERQLQVYSSMATAARIGGNADQERNHRLAMTRYAQALLAGNPEATARIGQALDLLSELPELSPKEKQRDYIERKFGALPKFEAALPVNAEDGWEPIPSGVGK